MGIESALSEQQAPRSWAAAASAGGGAGVQVPDAVPLLPGTSQPLPAGLERARRSGCGLKASAAGVVRSPRAAGGLYGLLDRQKARVCKPGAAATCCVVL